MDGGGRRGLERWKGEGGGIASAGRYSVMALCSSACIQTGVVLEDAKETAIAHHTAIAQKEVTNPPSNRDPAYLLVQMVITPLMRLELVDPAVAFAAEVAVEGFSCFPRRLGLEGLLLG